MRFVGVLALLLAGTVALAEKPLASVAGEARLAAVVDEGALMRQATQAMRTRQFGEAVGPLMAVVRCEPGYEGGKACALLARACLLSRQCQGALELLEPLREHWEGNAQAVHNVALCRYAVAEWQKDVTLPQAVADAFCQPEAEYPCEAPEIREVAGRIFASCGTDRERAKAAYDYVRLRTKYDKDLIPLGRQSVLFTLESRRAVCTGFAQLYITLCRAGGVPARLVAGEGRSGFHNWAEVWLSGKGWVPVDPTRGRRKAAFGRLDADVRAYASQRENW